MVLSRVFMVLLFLAISAVAAFLWSLLMVPVEIADMEETLRKIGKHDYTYMIPYYRDTAGFLLNMSRCFFAARLFALCSFVLLGTVVLVQSIKYSVIWFNRFLQTVAVLALFILFSWIGFRGIDPHQTGIDWMSVVNSVAAGVVFLIIGLFVFDKAAEV